ncbi:Cytochrome c family protein [Verrucomicrobia bacterium]|nr:Cytochrome c family protein [Verrucomicrobiota bacterium]
MNTDKPETAAYRPSLFRNWMSLNGLVIVIGSLFSFFLLFMLDWVAHFSNPYIGILTYLIAPGFLIFGLCLTVLGLLRERRKRGKTVALLPIIQIDLSRPRDRRHLGWFVAGSVFFLFLSAVGSYNTYHFTESVQFCGQACHTVMQPELITYQHGSHARVACVECHIGPGAAWFVKAKLSGTYQVYATLAKKYPTPIPTPVKNLRPAQETCEQCHWPKKFAGNLDRTYNYFLGDETNSPYTVRLLLNVGGGDPTNGRFGGIHWHMNVANKIEYLATDEERQKIPWVRLTDPQGVVTVFRSPHFTNEVNLSSVRRMDCMDCHNRPAHTYQTPDDAVSLAMSLGQLDRSLPYVKTNALYVLTQRYTNETQALEGIATTLAQRYPSAPSVHQAIAIVQQIYTNNFFPEMKASWQNYPNNIGHKDWPGCFRCHDGSHKAEDGIRTIKANDCNACHTILAQGSGAELDQLTPKGQKFKHPGDPVDGACNDCHSGGS